MGETIECKDCEVRGDCCHLNVNIRGVNVMLEDVVCPQLDKETKLCSDYENRSNYPWCLIGESLFRNGALPPECLYVKEDPMREPTPMRRIGEILETGEIPYREKYLIKWDYDRFNSRTFEFYIPLLLKLKEAVV